MSKENEKSNNELGIKWIKASSGSTYLCPMGFDASGKSEEELRENCVDESRNPENA